MAVSALPRRGLEPYQCKAAHPHHPDQLRLPSRRPRPRSSGETATTVSSAMVIQSWRAEVLQVGWSLLRMPAPRASGPLGLRQEGWQRAGGREARLPLSEAPMRSLFRHVGIACIMGAGCAICTPIIRTSSSGACSIQVVWMHSGATRSVPSVAHSPISPSLSSHPLRRPRRSYRRRVLLGKSQRAKHVRAQRR